MKIISWNTNGLRATAKQGNLINIFKEYDPDIVALQETKAELEQLEESIIEIPGYKFFISPCKTRRGYSGVAFYIKDKISNNVVKNGIGIKEFDDEGRNIVFEYKDIVLLNTYFPNGGGGSIRLDYKMRFYDAYLKHIKKLVKKGKKVVFMGDVNTAHTEIDLARPKENIENTGFLPIEREWIDKVVSSGFVDTYRELNPKESNMYTYWDQKTRARERNVGWRIDYFFVSKDLLNKVKKSYMLTEYVGSDHCPIVLEINID